MKKNYLITGIGFVLAGVILLGIALFTETRLESLLWGFTGATIVPGIATILKYFYWTRPKNRERYKERLENERIELNDELKNKLRDKSGCLAYRVGLLAVCAAILIFSILGQFEIIRESRLIVLFLFGYLVFQCAIGSVFYYYLLEKY